MTEARPHDLGRQLQVHILPLPNILSAAQIHADDLQSLDVTTYTVDHAEERLIWLADALDDVARRIRSLTAYTRTGAQREASHR